MKNLTDMIRVGEKHSRHGGRYKGQEPLVRNVIVFDAVILQCREYTSTFIRGRVLLAVASEGKLY